MNCLPSRDVFVADLTICFDFEERLSDWLIFSNFVLMSSRATKNQNKLAHSSHKKSVEVE